MCGVWVSVHMFMVGVYGCIWIKKDFRDKVC